MEHAAVPLKNLIVFLVAAGVVLPLFHRARIGAVLGFLLIGVLIGRHGLGGLVESHPWLYWVTITDQAMGAFLADLGVVFLLFLVGLELSVSRLWSLRRLVLGVGGLQFAFSTAAIGLCAALAGVSPAGSVVLGLCLAMSSTAIVMQLLEEQGRTASPVGRVAISILLFQDLMVAPVLFGTQALARGGAIAVELGTALLQAAAIVGGIVVLGRYLLRPLLRLAAQTGSRETLIAITMLIVIGSSWLTGHFGLSTALGAFLAGLLIAETEYSHQVEVDLAPLKGLLLGVFFITVGMAIDVLAAWRQIHVILAALIVLLAVKASVLYGAARALGVPRSVAGEVAILLPQGGEFAFIVIGLAVISKVIEPGTAQIAAVVAGLSMMVTPLCAMCAQRLGARLQQGELRHHVPGDSEAELADHVVIGGFGRVGQTLARLLDAENVPYVAFDTDGELVSEVAQDDPARLSRRRQPGRNARASAWRPGPRLRRHGERAEGRRAHGEGGAQDQSGRSRAGACRRSGACGAAAAAWGDRGDPRSRRSELAARRARPRGARHVGGRGGTPNRPGACRGAQPVDGRAGRQALIQTRRDRPTPSPSSGSRRSCRGSRWWRATSGRRRPAAPGPWSCRQPRPCRP